MTEFNEHEKAELLRFIQDNFSQQELEGIAVLTAMALNINIQGLNINQVTEQIIKTLRSMGDDEFNKRILDALTDKKKQKEITERIKTRNELVSVKTKKAKQLISPTDRVTKVLFDSRKNNTFYDDSLDPETPVKVGKKNKKDITVLVTIDISKLQEHITLSEDIMLNPNNRAVHDAVISLFCDDSAYFTTDMVYRLMNGYSTTHEAPDGAKKYIHDTLTKLMYTGIKIDAKDEAKAFGIEEFTYKGYVLPLTYTRAKINGVECECWHILEKPPLLALAERKNQINRCDVKLLDTGLNFTPENITLTNYLLEQILTMQNEKSRRNNTVLYDSVYEYLSIEAPTEKTAETKRRRIREKIKTILDAWVESGLIESYGEFLEGKKILGVHVSIKNT